MNAFIAALWPMSAVAGIIVAIVKETRGRRWYRRWLAEQEGRL